MRLRAPKFWHKKASSLGKVLSPLGWIYERASLFEQSLQQTHYASKPVICIGNLTLGGSGKTPTTLAFAEILKRLGHTPHILTRGYGGQINNAHNHKVSPSDTFDKVGDEPILMAKEYPVWVGRNRSIASGLAIKDGASILLMDDGLQNRRLHQDLKIVVADGVQGFGNAQVFPSGPLRTSLKKGLDLADAFVLINPKPDIQELLKDTKKPVLTASFEPTLPIPPQKIIAFAGIGYPEKFRIFLESQGFEIETFIPFSDHHPYSSSDIQTLRVLQEKYQLPLVTTEKDIIKIPPNTLSNLYSVPIKLKFDNEQMLIKILETLLKADTLT